MSVSITIGDIKFSLPKRVLRDDLANVEELTIKFSGKISDRLDTIDKLFRRRGCYDLPEFDRDEIL